MDGDKNRIEIFCDFDGTITLKDLGDELFKIYGQFYELNSLLKTNELTITEYWYKICATLDTKLTKDIIADFSLKFEIDPYFKNFVDYCKEHDINLTIVSDGYREYIEPLLHYHHLDELPLFANSLDFGKPITPIFYGTDESCNCLSASCKRNVLLTRTPENGIIVYIGDGYSDFCAAEHSDIIFAKKNLARYCNDNKVPHYPYNTFFDIRNIFEKVIFAKNKIKQRSVAAVKRKQAFETE